MARSIQELARDRRTIAFCVTVNHARNLSRALNAVGVPAGIVHGAMPRPMRAKALADFRAGRTQVLANVAVLTEGFDDPGVSCVAMARPTRSEGLYAQCVGRGTRLADGQAGLPDPRLRRRLDAQPVHAAFAVRLPARARSARRRRRRGARARGSSSMLDHPGFELEAGALTLREIQDRAAASIR